MDAVNTVQYHVLSQLGAPAVVASEGRTRFFFSFSRTRAMRVCEVKTYTTRLRSLINDKAVPPPFKPTTPTWNLTRRDAIHLREQEAKKKKYLIKNKGGALPDTPLRMHLALLSLFALPLVFRECSSHCRRVHLRAVK